MVDDLEEDEKEDYFIRDTDALIVTGKIVITSSYFRSKSFLVYKSMFMNKKIIIYSSITKLCYLVSLYLSNG